MPGSAASRLARYGLRLAALGYVAVLLLAPLSLVFWNTFQDGFGAAWEAVTTPAALHALWRGPW
jgi:sulfate/thiosulfate transport system permease protein